MTYRALFRRESLRRCAIDFPNQCLERKCCGPPQYVSRETLPREALPLLARRHRTGDVQPPAGIAPARHASGHRGCARSSRSPHQDIDRLHGRLREHCHRPTDMCVSRETWG